MCAILILTNAHSIGGSHKCGAGEMHPRKGTMMESRLQQGRQRLAGLDGSALCIKVVMERSASGRRMSTLKTFVSGKPEHIFSPMQKLRAAADG